MRVVARAGSNSTRPRGWVFTECPFVNRRVIHWPPEPLASAAKHAIRGYLQVEDAFHERVLARVR
jgi:hypothetical protein